MVRVMATANFYDTNADGESVFRRYGDEWEVTAERAERLVGYRIVSVIGALDAKVPAKAPKPKAKPKAKAKAKAKPRAKPRVKGKE